MTDFQTAPSLSRRSSSERRPPARTTALPTSLLAALALPLALAAIGCTPSIGDKCVLSTDCSVRGDRLCDTSQPGGYCTIFNCQGNACPDTAVCVLFGASVPGCGFDDRGVSRTGRSFCMAQCNSNGDCRGGYICADPRQGPWTALILDDNQGLRVCIAAPWSTPSDTDASAAPVCGPGPAELPEIDASAPTAKPRDAGTKDAEGGTVDAAAPSDADAGTNDASTGDAGDATTGDAGTSDAGTGDAGTSDAGTGDASDG